MRRLAVLFTMLFSVCLFSIAANASFTDVPQDSWYTGAVNFMEQAGLFNGVGGGCFAPANTMTRGMTVTVLYRLSGETRTDFPATSFTDLAAGSYYEVPVAWATEAGIVNGVTDTTFCPNDPVTREQLCKLIYCFCQYKGQQLPQLVAAAAFTDASSISSYAQDPVSRCQQSRIIKGYEDGTFRPHNLARRCEVAVIMQRLCCILSGDLDALEEPEPPEEPAHDPRDDWNLMLVNRWSPMPEGYADGIRLVNIGSGYQLDARAADDFLEMMAAMRAEGLNPVINSAFRLRSTQEFLFARKVQQYQSYGYGYSTAVELAKGWVAYPGTSEHELGLAVDISMYTYDANAIHSWLQKNAWRYGFIYRYPPDKTDITGVNPEPWHYRYVGREYAQKIYESGLCLEEYLDTLP